MRFAAFRTAAPAALPLAAAVLATAVLAAAFLAAGCELTEPQTAVLWTDRPELVAYAELFNASQARYKVEAYYRAAPARALAGAKDMPDIVVGSWLKGASTRSLFRPLDYFFEDLLLAEPAFYPKLLALGNIDGKQYLLPVSFNLPALIFSRDNSPLVATAFTLTLDQIRDLGKAYNELNAGSFLKMGFSPRWNDEFLFVAAALYGAAFREGSPLAWDASALEKAVAYLRAWTADANRDVAAEDEFAFKYMYDPAAKLAGSGRILFAYLPSQDLFTVSEDRRAGLDFRWIAKDESIPVIEGAAYLGLCKGSRARSAADAFVQWFYKEETQRAILESARGFRTNETVFGVADGFSALRAVNEQIFPRYYPGLLGHVPPADYLEPPNILPKDWIDLKQKVILPYLHEKARAAAGTPVAGLEERLAEWYRLNPPD
jgi:ABC-type glycerol-3-phosphate transport system substrate-binding protein